MNTMRRFTPLLLLAAVAVPAHAQGWSINPNATLNSSIYAANQVRWILTYNGTSSIFVDMVQTRFSSDNGGNQTVSVDLVAGSVVRSGTFTASTNWAGISFPVFKLDPGTQVQITFSGVAGLGRNATNGGLTANSEQADEFWWKINDNSPWTQGQTTNARPVLDFSGPQNVVPEPMTVALLGSGLAMVGGASLVRRRKDRSDG